MKKQAKKFPKIEARMRFGPTKKICPSCKSKHLNLQIGGITGKWKCEACGYEGVLVLEKED